MGDDVNHPSHYAEGWSNGAEVIDITENLNFNRGNAVKYIARAGKKDPSKELEDLRKAQWYLEREFKRMGASYDVTLAVPAVTLPAQSDYMIFNSDPIDLDWSADSLKQREQRKLYSGGYTR